MVEFISEATEQAENEDPPPEEEEVSKQESLEELVKAEAEELHETQEDKDYVDDTAPAEYAQQNDFSFSAPDLKNQIKPLVYVENGMPVVVDIFELYSRIQPEDDKSWLKKSL